MTFFESKYAVFVNKITNCRKSVNFRASHSSNEAVDFWKILAGMVHFMVFPWSTGIGSSARATRVSQG